MTPAATRMRLPLLAGILCFALFAPPSRAQTPPDTSGAAGRIIGRIQIRNRSVFDPEIPRYTRFPYPLLNRLHVRTRARVIRRELLFGPGDRYDEALAEESARNLRRFPFLGHVTLTPVARSDTVDVTVTTEDQWTTNPDLVIDRRGNLSRWGIGLEEENFLGLGKALRIRFLTTSDRTLWRTIYEDRRLLGSRWTFRGVGIRSDDGSLAEARIARPLYALSARWSFEGSYLHERGFDRLYDGGLLTALVEGRRHTGGLSLTRVWPDGTPRKKLALNLTGESRLFEGRIDVRLPSAPSAQALLASGPADRRNLRAEAAWGLERVRFVKGRFIDHAGLIEDVRVGESATLTLGRAQGLGRLDDYNLFSASLEKSARIGGAHLIFLSVEGGAHLEWGRLDNGTLTAFYHHYYQGLPSQTLVFGAAYLRTWRMDPPFQLVLGEDVGLRGYPARQFTGDRLLLLNFEDRLFTPVEFATLRLGFAAFCDAGMAWRPGQPARPRDLRASAGASLRLAFPKFADAPVFRFDLAFPLRRASGMSRYSIGFSFSPIFWSTQAPQAVVKRF